MYFAKVIILGLATVAAAHPGHEEAEHRHAVATRASTQANKRALEGCASKLESRGVAARSVERRKATMAKHRQAKRIPKEREEDKADRQPAHSSAPYTQGNTLNKRSTIGVLTTDHEGDIDATDAEGDESVVFNSTTCAVLNPEGEVGPFYVLGEYVRADVTEEEVGVPLVADIQFVDVNTCEPLVGVWADIWNCNSTGVYTGVQSSGNGNSDDTTNLNNTALRGIQQTDDDGVVQFTTIFPGHYTGRATHMHVVVHENATQLANGTLTGGTVPHIGQFFWDQSLIDTVEATSPYNTNTQPLTRNVADRVFGQQETQGTTSDPVFNYVYFSDDLSDGLFTWLVVGINPSAEYTPTYSFELTENGGEPVDGGGLGGGSGSGPF